MPYIAGMATRDEMEKSPGVMNASDDPEECNLNLILKCVIEKKCQASA